MGRHHGLFGAVVFFGAEVALGHTQQLGVLVASSAICAGAAMAPDLDEPDSSVAHACEPFSGAVSWVVARIAGGHRQATHSLLGVGVSVGLCYLALDYRLAAAGLFGFFILVAWRGLSPYGTRHFVVSLLVATGAGLAVALSGMAVGFLPVAVGVGYSVHLLGDMATVGGVPLLWPLKHHFSWPVLGHTGSKRELVATAGLWVIMGVLVYSSGIWHLIHLGELERTLGLLKK